MGENMRLISFEHLVDWCLEEYKSERAIFGIKEDKFYKNKSGNYLKTVFGDKLGSAIGPAAGPHCQLAQNIIGSYLAGSRFIELKTVQIMDGEQIQHAVNRPCIYAEDECYNCEWSTELTVQQAFAEYVKAYFLIQVLAKELGLADYKDFAYNMSVGYDLEGIKSEKIDNYIEGLKDASNTEAFKACKQFLSDNLNKFSKYNKEDLDKISPNICQSITLSTLHGCPAHEIESISTYLLTEKNLNTFIKCNPTLLGYEFARETTNKMGYDYISFTDFHFKDDLQYNDAVAMFKRLMLLAKEKDRSFGLKLTNTFPVDVKRNELPSEEMYMSGRSLFPLSITLAAKLSKEFDGKLPIAYSGGADAANINEILATGIQPVTMATTILKPGGYERFKQIAEVSEAMLTPEFKDIDTKRLMSYAESVIEDPRYQKSYRDKVKSRKTENKLPLIDCYMAPCKDGGCPINQQIPEYLKLVSDGKYDEAINVIANDNTAPSILGTLCSHPCQDKCTRVDYDKSIQIRAMKFVAADNAQQKFVNSIKESELKSNKKVAVIGAGPGGIAAASYLRRNGMDVIVFEKLDKPYGIVRYIIPKFRIAEELIERDYQIAVKQGVKFRFNTDVTDSYEELKNKFDYVIVATGAWMKGNSPVKEGQEKVIDALDYLWKARNEKVESLGRKVAVIGAGDVAMDCARSAFRQRGVEEVHVVYRRTESYMPASQEDVNEVKEEGIKINELLAPVKYDGKVLTCEKMSLGDFDSSGRKSVVGTGEFVDLEFDTVIGATGAKVDSKPFKDNNINMDEKGRLKLLPSLESNIENVYIIGDCKQGPSTIVKAMADAKIAALDILKKENLGNDFKKFNVPMENEQVYTRKAVLVPIQQGKEEGERCLKCDQICEICKEVCPNRANVIINIDGYNNLHQILHIDGMCNECGNCGVFCPYEDRPYKDKVTLFWSKEEFEDSANVGFLKLSDDKFLVRAENGNVIEHTLGDGKISNELEKFIKAVLSDYKHFLNPTVIG